MWKKARLLSEDPEDYRYLSLNLTVLNPNSRDFPAHRDHARRQLERIITDHPGSILLGEFELSVTEAGLIKLGLHGWLLSRDHHRVRMALRRAFRGKRRVQSKRMKPGPVEQNFTRGISYACKLPKIIFRVSRGNLVDHHLLFNFIRIWESLRSGHGRKGLRVSLGMRAATRTSLSSRYPSKSHLRVLSSAQQDPLLDSKNIPTEGLTSIPEGFTGASPVSTNVQFISTG
jgi:hypothetical protein